MKVSWVTDTFEQDNGVAHYIKGIAPHLAKKCDFTLYTGRKEKEYPYKVVSAPHVHYPFLRGAYDVNSPFMKYEGDVLHVHTVHPLGLAARFSKIPKVVTTHALPVHLFESLFKRDVPEVFLKIGWKYLIWYLNGFDRVVCQTEQAKKTFQAHGLKRRVELIPNGIDLSKFRNANPERFLKKYNVKKPFALFLGRMDPSKRPHWVVEIAKKLPERQFVFIGWGTMKLEKLENTLFTGRVNEEDKIDALHAASMVIMPSSFEIESVVAQEAMACGTPLVISDNPDLKCVVGKAGISCANPAEMTDAVKKLFEDEGLRKKLAETALKEIEEKKVELSVEKLMKLYEGLSH